MFNLFWLLNLPVAYWNIHSLGKIWVETRHAGGKASFLAMMGAALTALCLTWNILVIEANVASTMGWLSPGLGDALINLAGWVVGLDIVIALALSQSTHWAVSYRQDVLSQADSISLLAYMDLRDSYHAASSLHYAFKGVVEAVFSDDDSLTTAFVVLVIGLTLLSGILLSAVGIWYFAGRGQLERG